MRHFNTEAQDVDERNEFAFSGKFPVFNLQKDDHFVQRSASQGEVECGLVPPSSSYTDGVLFCGLCCWNKGVIPGGWSFLICSLFQCDEL